MPIKSLLCRAYNELANGFKAKGRPRKRRDDIKDTLQQHGLTNNDATKQARTLKTPRHQTSGEQQPSPSSVIE
jgi:hypothetical protein